MLTSKPSRILRKKGKTSESVNPPLDNHIKLAYNILKNLEDDIVSEKEIPELDQCSECNNEILTRPPKVITILSCGHTFHRICIEKKLLLTMLNTCPFPDCGKNVDITNEESPISDLSNRMNERFILSSPILWMEGVENTGFQPVKGYLRCAKCSGDLSSWLPPVSSIRFPLQPQEPPKPLVYLTCKHIVHYECIVNPRKLCPICPSTDMELEEEMEIDDDDMVTDTQESSTTQKKCTRKSTTEKSSSKKKKTTNKDDVSTMNKELKHSYGKDGAKALVEEELRKQIPEMKFSNEALRKRRGRSEKAYKLFNSIGKSKIERIRSFFARSILNLSDTNVNRVIAGVLRAEQN